MATSSQEPHLKVKGNCWTAGTSNLRAADVNATRQKEKFHLEVRRGSAIGDLGEVNYLTAAERYLQTIHDGDITSIPGLALNNIFKKKVTEGHGMYSLKTFPEIIQTIDVNYHATIFGCNDQDFFSKNAEIRKNYIESCLEHLWNFRGIRWRYQHMQSPEELLRLFFDFLQVVYTGTSCEVIFLATLLPNARDIDNGQDTNFKNEINSLITSADRGREWELWITDRQGKRRSLKWRAIDLVPAVAAAGEPRDPIHYCTHLRDGLHIRPFYVELFLRKLNQEILMYESNSKRRKITNEKKKSKRQKLS